MCYERHPESVRTVSKVFAAGCDSVSGDAAHPAHPATRPKIEVYLRGFLDGCTPFLASNRWFLSGIRSPEPAPKWNSLYYGGIQEGRFGSQHDLWAAF